MPRATGRARTSGCARRVLHARATAIADGRVNSAPWPPRSTSATSQHAYGAQSRRARSRFHARGRPDRLPARALGLRQDDGAALPRRLRAHAGRRRSRCPGRVVSRARPHRAAGGAAASAWCSRISRCFRISTVAGNVGVRLRRGVRRRKARDASPRCSSSSALPAQATPIRTSSPAASSSASRSPARSRRQPDLLLLDEPFSNLDVDLRERLSLEVREILKASGHHGDPRHARPARSVRARRRDRRHARRRASSSGTARTTSITGRARASSPISWGRACSCAASRHGSAACSRPSSASSARRLPAPCANGARRCPAASRRHRA